jgi:hypothetical protein
MIKKIYVKMYQSSLVRGLNYWVDNLSSKHWNYFPFGNKVKCNRENYINLWKNEKVSVYSDIDKYELNTGYKIDKEWFDNLALHTQVVVKKSPLCWQHGRILYSTLSNWLNDNKDFPVVTIWETGTARGFSATCMSMALEDHNRYGRIITFDVLPHHKKMFWNCVDDLERAKSRSELLKPWRQLISKYVIFQQGDTKISLKKVAVERIHFAFLDGSHTYDDVMFEFNQIKDYQHAGDIIVFDDYTERQFPGLVRAVDEICSFFQYDRVDVVANKDRGYVVATKK